MTSASKCSISVYLNEEYHKTTYSSQIGSRHIDEFAEEDQPTVNKTQKWY